MATGAAETFGLACATKLPIRPDYRKPCGIDEGPERCKRAAP